MAVAVALGWMYKVLVLWFCVVCVKEREGVCAVVYGYCVHVYVVVCVRFSVW